MVLLITQNDVIILTLDSFLFILKIFFFHLFDLIYQTEVDLSNPREQFYVKSYKSISYKEDENYDPDDGGFSYEYGSERGYHSYGRNTMVDVWAEGKGYLTIEIEDSDNPVKVHPDFDFIANLIDMNGFDELTGNGQEPYTMEDYDGENWPYDGVDDLNIAEKGWVELYLSNIHWGSGKFDADGNLTFYVSWDAVGQYEYEDDGGY